MGHYRLETRGALAAGLYPGWDRGGEPQLTLVCKTGFAFDDRGLLRPLEPPEPVVTADEYAGDPAASSLVAADETVPFKDGAEFYLFGTAHPPPGARVMAVSVTLAPPRGPPVSKTPRVCGPRRWERRLGVDLPSAPEPLEPLPLRYEFAFGGEDPDTGEPHPANPAGCGINGRGWRQARGALPRIERGPRFMERPGHRPPPAGFGPLPPFWEPRAAAAGTPRAHPAEAGGCPVNDDSEPDLFNCAPPDQRLPAPFSGGETLTLEGFFADVPRVRLVLPAFAPRATVLERGGARRLVPVTDTLVIDTDARRIHLVARAGLPWDPVSPGAGHVIAEAGEVQPAPAQHGEVALP